MMTFSALALALQILSAKDVPLAVVVRVKGHATAGPAKEMRALKSGDVVSKNWQIKTGSDGRVLLRLLSDRALADIKASSLVELDVRPGKEGGSIQDVTLHGGQIAVSLPPGGSDEKTSSATTVASAKTAQYGMSTETNGQTRVDVLSGIVQVCNQMTGEHALVAPGQSQSSGYDGLGPLRQIPSDSSLARMDGAPMPADTSAPTTELVVPFVDPVTGKASTLSVFVRRSR